MNTLVHQVDQLVVNEADDLVPEVESEVSAVATAHQTYGIAEVTNEVNAANSAAAANTAFVASEPDSAFANVSSGGATTLSVNDDPSGIGNTLMAAALTPFDTIKGWVDILLGKGYLSPLSAPPSLQDTQLLGSLFLASMGSLLQNMPRTYMFGAQYDAWFCAGATANSQVSISFPNWTDPMSWEIGIVVAAGGGIKNNAEAQIGAVFSVSDATSVEQLRGWGGYMSAGGNIPPWLCPPPIGWWGFGGSASNFWPFMIPYDNIYNGRPTVYSGNIMYGPSAEPFEGSDGMTYTWADAVSIGEIGTLLTNSGSLKDAWDYFWQTW